MYESAAKAEINMYKSAAKAQMNMYKSARKVGNVVVRAGLSPD